MSHMDRLRPIGIFAFMLWMMFVLAAFYAVQKPISAQDLPALAELPRAFESPASWSGLADVLLNLLTVAALSASALVIGFRLSPLAYPRGDSSGMARAEFWLFASGLGFGAMGTFMLGLALLGWLHPLVLLAIAVLLLLWKPQQVLARFIADLTCLPHTRLPRPLAIFGVISLLLTLLGALAPPNAFDAWLYHLTIPKRALEMGRLAPWHSIIPAEDYPLLMAMLYLLALIVRGDGAAQLLHFVFGLLTLALIAHAARRFYSTNAMPYALALALSMPMLLLLASWAYVDLALAFYTLAAVYAYRRWREQRLTAQGSNRYLIASALMAGFAMGLKYTSFVLPLGVVALIAWQERRRTLPFVAQFSMLSLLVAAPWYLKNYFFTGNPVYPFVFGGADWDAWRAAWYARAGSGIGLDPIALLTLPLVITLGYRDATFVDGRIGPLILSFAPLLFMRGRRSGHRPCLDPFVIMSLLFFAFWTLGVIGSTSLWQARLLLPGLALLIPPLAQSLAQLAQLDQPSFSLRRIVNVIIALVLALTLVTQFVDFVKINPLAYLVGAESRDHFLVRQWGDHVTAMFAVNALPADVKVQFLWEPRSYLASRAARADLLLDALPHLMLTTGSLEAGVRTLKAEGFTHILVWEAGLKFAVANMRDQFGEGDLENVRRLERDFARIVYENPSYRLLAIQ